MGVIERALRLAAVICSLLSPKAKRIVQIENTYDPLTRTGEVNYHNGK